MENLALLARSINPSAFTLFHVPALKPSARWSSRAAHVAPKLEWNLESTSELRVGIRFAEARLSDLICRNECAAMGFRGYGKIFITFYGFSPDAFLDGVSSRAF